MFKKDKKQLIRIAIILAIMAVIICVLLNYTPKTKQEETDNNDFIDTSEIDETSLNWEDITHIQIGGYEGNLTLYFTYDEIPDFQTKLEEINTEWEEKREILDPDNDQEEIQANSDWWNQLLGVYSEEFCQAPADLNNHKKGDTVKITCDSETLRKLNYKFSDGFEYTLTDVYDAPSVEDNEETQESEQTDVTDNDNSTSQEQTSSETSSIITQEKNDYWELGNDVFINVRDISSVNLNVAVEDGQRIFVVVENEEDFQTVKEYVTTHTNKTYVIEYDGYWYGINGDFEEKEVCKGIAIGD